jgi:hypothetical protein
MKKYLFFTKDDSIDPDSELQAEIILREPINESINGSINGLVPLLH